MRGSRPGSTGDVRRRESSVQYGRVPDEAFQDQMRDNFCWGCGADNPSGLQLKSHWHGDLALARWQPSPEHAAGPRHLLNGGVIATLLDCHAVGTAIADAYRSEGRSMRSEPEIWYATASMNVEYLRPTPLDDAVELTARVTARDDRSTTLDCVLSAASKERARATVRAVRVPNEWRHPAPASPRP
jgi:acyl-coenzyme A thioesterase PaaI-like protein